MYIKRGVSEVEQIVAQDLFGGHGIVRGRQVLGEDSALIGVLPGFPGDFDSGINFIHETIMDVGTLVGTHPHEKSEEVYFFIEGNAKMIVDGETVMIQQGDAILTKKGSTHSIENVGEVPLRFMVVEGKVE